MTRLGIKPDIIVIEDAQKFRQFPRIQRGKMFVFRGTKCAAQIGGGIARQTSGHNRISEHLSAEL